MFHLSKWLTVNEPTNLINLRNASSYYKYEFDPSIEDIDNNLYKTINYFSFNKMGIKSIKRLFISKNNNNVYKFSYSNLIPLIQIQLQGENKGIIWLIYNFSKYQNYLFYSINNFKY